MSSYDGNGQRVTETNGGSSETTFYLGNYYVASGGTQQGIIYNQVSDASTSGIDSCMALDPLGVLYFVWNTGSQIAFNTLNGTPSLLGTGTDPVITADSNGFLHVVWSYNSSTNSQVLYRFSTNGGENWSLPLAIYSVNRAQNFYPKIVVGNDDTLHLTWSDGGSRYAYRDPGSGIWSSSTSVGNQFADIAAAPDGDVYAAWVHYNLNTDIIYLKRWDGTAWVDLQEVANVSGVRFSTPVLDVDDAGTIHIAWADQDTDTLYYRSRTASGTWSNVEVITDDATISNPFYVTAALSAIGNGNVYLSWSTDVGIGFSHLTPGASWSEISYVDHPENLNVNQSSMNCMLVNSESFGVHLTFLLSSPSRIIHALLNRSQTVSKRYFAGGQQVATRVDGELFYHLNDPSGTSLTMVDETGTQHWQVVYDGYGMVLTTLTNTLPITHTWMQTLSGVPDATSNLVYQGNGRYYDPALGRPLQPNPSGALPTVPQALNRYTATSLGQPGVFQSTQSSLITQLLESSRNQVPGLLAGPPATALAIHRWAETVYKSVPSGFGIVQLEGTVRSLRFLGDSFDYSPMRLANGFPRRVISRLFKGFRLQTATGRRYVGDTAQELVEFQERMAQRGISASLLSREFDEVVDAAATSASRNIAKGWGGVLGVGIGGLLNVGIQYAYDYDNPYLTGWQKAQRAGVSGIAGGAAGVAGLYAAGLWGGPVGVGVAFTIGVILELEVVPRIFEFVGIIPTRDLHAMTTP